METKELSIPVVIGTGRDGRHSEHVARFVEEEFSKTNVQTNLVDIREFAHTATTPPWDDNPNTRPWRDIVGAADGLIIVTPEYNYGYPGELKMLLDQALDEYRYKPVGLCGVSSGLVGGARAIEALKLTCLRIGLTPVHPSVYFPNVKETFDAEGNNLDSEQPERLVAMFKEVIWYATALKQGRET